MILNVNRQLLDSLEERISKWSRYQCIGDVFLKFAPFLKLYIQYINNSDEALTTISNVTEHNQKFQAFLQNSMKNPEIKKMGHQGLSNFHILPVQRV